jgi:hypothetical protein
MELEVTGPVFFWKGPAPWYFVLVEDPQAAEIEAASAMVTYGWGMIPANLTLGNTEWYTALWPKDGLYVIPLKARVRKAEAVDEGDVVTVRVSIDL